MKQPTMLAPQQLPITTDRPIPITTTKEKSIIVPITSFTRTLTQNSMKTTNGDSKRITIDDLVESRINRLIIILIKTYTTILNVIMASMIFTTLVNDLKMIYLNIIKWNCVRKTHD